MGPMTPLGGGNPRHPVPVMIGLELGAGPRDAAGRAGALGSGGVIRLRAAAGAAIVPRARARGVSRRGDAATKARTCRVDVLCNIHRTMRRGC